MTSQLGFPVEVWVEVFGHYLQPDFLFSADFIPSQIEAFHESLLEENLNKYISLGKKKRTRLMLVCRTWKSIVDQFPSRHKLTRGLKEPDITSESDGYSEELIKFTNMGSRLIVKGKDSSARGSYSELVSVLCLYIPGAGYANYERIEGLVKNPQYLEILHLSASSYRILSKFMRGIAGTFCNLQILSLCGNCLVPNDVAITFSQLSTLILDINDLNLTYRLPPTWQFPKLRHLSLEHDLSESHKGSLFEDLLERYGGQLYTLRHPFWGAFQSPKISFTRLQIFVTDITQFYLEHSLLFDQPYILFSIEHLVQVADLKGNNILSSDMAFGHTRLKKYASVRENIPYGTGASSLGAIERLVYRGMEKTIPFFPRLKAIYIPEDVASIRIGVLDPKTAASFASLQEVCDAKGIRILNLQGEKFPVPKVKE